MSAIRILFATLLALLASAWQAGADCSTRRIAVLEGRESVDVGGFVTTYVQRFTLMRDGTGTEGRWTGVEWDHTTILPVAMNAEGLAAMSSVPDQAVPGVRATCTTTVTGPKSVRLLCTGQYPFEVTNGVIRWVGRPEKIGAVTPGSPGSAPRLSLSMYPPNPYYSGVVSGPVNDPGQLGFKPVVSIKGYSAAGPYSEVQVNISVQPPVDEAAISLDASARYTGKGEAPFWAKNATPNDIRLNARLHGDPQTRARIAGATTITATARLEGCVYSSSWSLADLALASGVSP